MIHVTSQNSNVTNVTSEYYDIEARLNVLEGERAVYEKMLQNAKTTSEMLSIQDRLYNVISEIEAFKTRLRVLDSQVSYSTVTINLSEVVEYTNVTTAETGFGERVSNAFSKTWQNFIKAAQTLLLALIYALPALIFLAAAGLIAIVVVIIVKKAKKKKRAAYLRNMQTNQTNQMNQMNQMNQ
jgi:type III secretory pathway component EscV